MGRSSSRKLRRTGLESMLSFWLQTPSPFGLIYTQTRIRPTNPADGVTLRDLTVQPATRKRYDAATNKFLSFLQQEGQALPKEKNKMDPLVCEYVEYLWSSGAGRGLACDTLAGLQDLQPNLENSLPGALLKTWHVNEVPNRAPPLPEHIVQAMAGWGFFKGHIKGFFKGHITFAISLLVGFYTMLRAGELLGLRSSHLLCESVRNQVLISLGLTKGGK